MAYRILVVDDEPDVEALILQKFRGKIRSGEFNFVFAENGAVALEKLKQDDTIDLVFTDINMPVMDGLTLLHQIKEQNLFHKTVVVSAYGDIKNIRTAMNRGAFDFIIKPIDFSDFEITLDKTVEETQRVKDAVETKNRLEKVRHEKEELILNQNKMLEQQVEERTHQLVVEKKKSDDLLLNILPAETAEELKQKGSAEAKYYENVSVLFTDFVNFTRVSEALSAKELVQELNHYFINFDNLITDCGLEKIKTVGDGYIAVCGLPVSDEAHAVRTVKAALAIREFMDRYIEQCVKNNKQYFDIRIGIHSGPVVAGIVGVKKFAYDIWGDTVNNAARMEQSCQPGKINISHSTYEIVKEQFPCEYRGKIAAKNKGEIDMYFVNKPAN